MACEHAVLAPDNACHHIAIGVGISNTLAVDDTLGGSREVIPHIIENSLDTGYLVESDGCSGISLNATLALAGIEVATEHLRQYVGGYQYVVNIYYHIFQKKGITSLLALVHVQRDRRWHARNDGCQTILHDWLTSARDVPTAARDGAKHR